MDVIGDDFFTGATFSLNEDRDTGIGYLVELLPDNSHCRARPEDDAVVGQFGSGQR